MADKKKPGEESILLKKELIVQKLSSESKTTTMKFTRESPREFVEYDYDEIMPGNKGPSCTRLDRLPSLNLIFDTFYNSYINQ